LKFEFGSEPVKQIYGPMRRSNIARDPTGIKIFVIGPVFNTGMAGHDHAANYMTFIRLDAPPGCPFKILTITSK